MNRLSLYAAAILQLAACAAEPAKDDLGTTEQAVISPTLRLVCRSETDEFIVPDPSMASQDCVAPSGPENVVFVTWFQPDIQPGDTSFYRWYFNGTPIDFFEFNMYQVTDGCGEDDSFCDLMLTKRNCAGAPSRTVKVTVQKTTTRNGQNGEAGTSTATIPASESCSGAVCPIPQTPILAVAPEYCQGFYTRSWAQVAIADRYQLQAKPGNSTIPWDQVPLTPGLPGIILDTAGLGGRSSVGTTTTLMRLRACNECGCSPFGYPATVYYYPTCQ